MPATQQTITNLQDGPIYVLIEPWARMHELKPGDQLTLIYESPTSGDALDIQWANANELIIWVKCENPLPTLLVNGEADQPLWSLG